MDKISLRKCAPPDADALKSWQYPHLTPAEITAMIDRWNQGTYEGRYFEMLAVTVNAQIVGTISLFAQKDGSISCGPDIFPSCRRRGYAFAALTMALQKAAGLGYTRAIATVRRDNAASLALHQKLGFLPIGEGISRRGHPVLHLERALPLPSPHDLS